MTKSTRLKRPKANPTSYMIRTPLYRYPLGAAMLVLLAMAILPVGRKAAA